MYLPWQICGMPAKKSTRICTECKAIMDGKKKSPKMKSKKSLNAGGAKRSEPEPVIPDLEAGPPTKDDVSEEPKFKVHAACPSGESQPCAQLRLSHAGGRSRGAQA